VLFKYITLQRNNTDLTKLEIMYKIKDSFLLQASNEIKKIRPKQISYRMY